MTTLIQTLANQKGWSFKLLAQRWGKSERQISRIARDNNQRDIDAVNGLPERPVRRVIK